MGESPPVDNEARGDGGGAAIATGGEESRARLSESAGGEDRHRGKRHERPVAVIVRRRPRLLEVDWPGADQRNIVWGRQRV